MKSLISLVLFLVLFGCENNASESKNTTNAPAKATTELTTSYLDQPLKAKVNQHGLYRLVRSGGLIDDPNTSTGKAVASPVIEHVKTTERIPLMKGAQLYLQYRLWYLSDQPAYIKLRRVLRHPEMKLPNGKIATGSDYMLRQKVSINQAIGYTGYGLDEDYELIEGDWVFEIWYQDKKMVEQKFTTYWPDEEEIARLVPILALGNDVMTQTKTSGSPDSKRSAPVMVIRDKELAENSALMEMKQAIDNPNSQKPPQ
jgi:hypothetical protein